MVAGAAVAVTAVTVSMRRVDKAGLHSGHGVLFCTLDRLFEHRGIAFWLLSRLGIVGALRFGGLFCSLLLLLLGGGLFCSLLFLPLGGGGGGGDSDVFLCGRSRAGARRIGLFGELGKGVSVLRD